VSVYQETFFVSLRPRTLARLETLLNRAIAEGRAEFEDDEVLAELGELENEIRARLQRIAMGDLQR